MRTLLDRKNISSRTNGQVAARRVTGLIIKRLWPYRPSNTTVACRHSGLIATTQHPCNRSGPLHLRCQHRPQQITCRWSPVARTQGQNQGTVGPISALWEWHRDENHHQAQLDICTQFGPDPPGSLGAGSHQTDR